MANEVYLVDPDGMSGMLEDGTEFVAVLTDKKGCGDACQGCMAQGRVKMCTDLPVCFSWEAPVKTTHRTPPSKSWIYVKKV